MTFVYTSDFPDEVSFDYSLGFPDDLNSSNLFKLTKVVHKAIDPDQIEVFVAPPPKKNLTQSTHLYYKVTQGIFNAALRGESSYSINLQDIPQSEDIKGLIHKLHSHQHLICISRQSMQFKISWPAYIPPKKWYEFW